MGLCAPSQPTLEAPGTRQTELPPPAERTAVRFCRQRLEGLRGRAALLCQRLPPGFAGLRGRPETETGGAAIGRVCFVLVRPPHLLFWPLAPLGSRLRSEPEKRQLTIR